MSYTKGDFVYAALDEIGISSYDFDISPEQTDAILKRLDSLMASWNARGIRLGYPIPNGPKDSSLEQDSNVPDSAWEAIITNLAIRIAPSYGKAVSIDTKVTAKQALNTLYSISATPGTVQGRPIPRGAGHKNISSVFTPDPVDHLEAGPDGKLDF